MVISQEIVGAQVEANSLESVDPFLILMVRKLKAIVNFWMNLSLNCQDLDKQAKLLLLPIA